MNNQQNTLDQRKAAIFAGVALLLMAIIAPIANFKFIYGLISIGNPVKTVQNILIFQNIFRLGILMLLIVAILDIVVAWGLYIVFEPVNKAISVLASCFRLLYAAVLVVALSNLMNVLHLLNGAGYLTTFNQAQLNTQVIISIKSFDFTWNLGMVLFSLHLFLLGYLVFKSGFYPKFLGILIEVSALGYMIDSIGKILICNYNLTISSYTFVGEVLLIFWLLFKKINNAGYQIPEGDVK